MFKTEKMLNTDSTNYRRLLIQYYSHVSQKNEKNISYRRVNNSTPRRKYWSIFRYNNYDIKKCSTVSYECYSINEFDSTS